MITFKKADVGTMSERVKELNRITYPDLKGLLVSLRSF